MVVVISGTSERQLHGNGRTAVDEPGGSGANCAGEPPGEGDAEEFTIGGGVADPSHEHDGES